MLGVVSPRNKHQGVYLFEDRPWLHSILAEKAIDKSNGAIVGSGPAIREKACIVKRNDSFRSYKRRPLSPVAFDGLLAVIAINQQKIDGRLPIAHCVVTQRFQPVHPCPPSGGNRAMRRSLLKIQRRNPRKMKRID